MHHRVDKRKTNRLIAGIAGSALTLALVLTAACGKADGAKDAAGQAASAGQGSSAVTDEPLYRLDFISSIDLSARTHTPGEKQAGMTWDKTVFYWLETAEEEGQPTGISTCNISRMQLYNEANKKVIEYIIYKDPDDGKIYKIVSIEQREDDLLLTDFYYQDGKPNFIFRRGDSVYTPTYATIGKVGERYYFDNDVLVKWRLINTPNVIEEQTLTVNPSANYSQQDYFEMDSEQRDNYDAVENSLLNLAYATYERIAQGGAIGSVSGRVTDSAGNPLDGRTVCIYRSGDDALLYKSVTDNDGSFLIYVYMDGTDCYLTVPGENIYRDIHADNLLLSMDLVSYDYGQMAMYGVDEPDQEVTLRVCDASKVDSARNAAGSGDQNAQNVATNQEQDEGQISGQGLAGATVTFRQGISVRAGEATQAAESDESGNVTAMLNAGLYTAELRKDGYAPLYVNIEVTEGEHNALGNYYLAPVPEEGQTAVLLTWEGTETDLDLTIFTPYQDDGGDMQRIGGSRLRDSYGNYILSDNTSGCELAYVDTSSQGAYKIYVNDYTDTQAGKYNADALTRRNVHVYILDADGGMSEYAMPSGEDGVVWEVAELNGSKLTAGNRVYVDLTGKNWWTASAKGLKWVVSEMVDTKWWGATASQKRQYDEQGNLTEVYTGYSEGEDYSVDAYSYDRNGRRNRQGEMRGDDPDWSYDEKGRCIRANTRVYGETANLEYHYDDAGNCVEWSQSLPREDERGAWTAQAKYDERGRCTECTFHYARRDIKEKYECVYDEGGNLSIVRCRTMDSADGPMYSISQMEYEYDNTGNCVSAYRVKMVRNGNTTKTKIEYEYDENGNCVKEEYSYANGSYGFRSFEDIQDTLYRGYSVDLGLDSADPGKIEYSYIQVPSGGNSDLDVVKLPFEANWNYY